MAQKDENKQKILVRFAFKSYTFIFPCENLRNLVVSLIRTNPHAI